MRSLHILSVVLSFTLTAFASIAAPGHHLSSLPTSIKAVQQAGVAIQNFLISDVQTYSVLHSVNSSLSRFSNTTIQFGFKDLNSNTETTCTDSWVDTNATNTVPYSYVLCDPTTIAEYFQWKFISYSGPQKFQLAFAHLFADPVNFPPPFDIVEYFSETTNFTLVCMSASGLGTCSLPSSQNPVSAIINGIAL